MIVVVAVMWFVVLPLHLLLAVLYYRRAHLHPIVNRSPALNSFMNVALILEGAVGGSYAVFSDWFPCVVSFWLTTPFLVFSLTAMIARAADLLFRFELERLKNAQAAEGPRSILRDEESKSGHGSEHGAAHAANRSRGSAGTDHSSGSAPAVAPRSNFFFTHRHWTKPRFFAKIVAVQLGLWVVACAAALPVTHFGPTCTDPINLDFFLVLLLVSGVYLVALSAVSSTH